MSELQRTSMNRKEFVTSALSLGCICSGGAAVLAGEPSEGSREIADLKQKIDFMQKRMARLVRALDKDTRARVLATMGRECAKEFGFLIDRFRGKPEEFLQEARRQWMESASYDAEKGVIRVVDRSTSCTCAFVQPGVTPGDFCDCTLGWQKEAYSAILGESVDAEIEGSVLRGDPKCAFRIRCRRS